MRLVATPDSTVDWIDSALWLTVPFDGLLSRLSGGSPTTMRRVPSSTDTFMRRETSSADTALRRGPSEADTHVRR